MGREVSATLAREPELELVGGVDPRANGELVDVPGSAVQIPVGADLADIIERVNPRVMVDFTHPDAAMGNVRVALKHKVSPVVGTSGIKPADLEEIERLAAEAGVAAVVVPNFAIGANLMLHFARIASKFLSAAEIIELHHDGKVDAPSG